MQNFNENFEKAKKEALNKIEFVASKPILSNSRYDFATDDYERWLFVTDKQTNTEIVIFVPMTGDYVVDEISLFDDESGFCVSGWMGEACYTFEACFNELGMYDDIKLLS